MQPPDSSDDGPAKAGPRWSAVAKAVLVLIVIVLVLALVYRSAQTSGPVNLDVVASRFA